MWSRGRAARRAVHERQLDRPDADAATARPSSRRAICRGSRRAARSGARAFPSRDRDRTSPRCAPARAVDGRHLPRLGPEDLDQLCGPRRNLFPAVPHRRRSQEGHLDPAGADGHAGHHRAPDPLDHRRGRHPRGVLRRLRGAGRRRCSARRARRGRSSPSRSPTSGSASRAIIWRARRSIVRWRC